MWDAAHALLTITPRTRANRTRCQTPSLLRGAYLRQRRARHVAHSRAGAPRPAVSPLCQPISAEGQCGGRSGHCAHFRGGDRGRGHRTGSGAAAPAGDGAGRLALERLDPLWEELFPEKQARIIRLLVDRVDIGIGGADVRLKLEALASLARDLAVPPAEAARVAA
jgi:hypothetical protein